MYLLNNSLDHDDCTRINMNNRLETLGYVPQSDAHYITCSLSMVHLENDIHCILHLCNTYSNYYSYCHPVHPNLTC